MMHLPKSRKWLLLALVGLCLAGLTLLGFDDGYRFILQLQNGSSVLGTFVKYGVLKCSTGMSCSVSGSTFTMTASGGAGTVTVTGSPVSGQLAAFSGASSITSATAHNVALPLTCAAASGSGTAYTCSTSPSFTPADGDVLLFQADLASGASPTLVVNVQAGTPALNKNLNGALVALVANDLVAGGDYLIEFDGTNWQVQGNLGTALYQASSGNTFPTLNQNTTGSAGSLTILTTLGDILYENATPANARLAGNTTSTKNFLVQTGNGTISAVPAWGTIAASDLPAK